MAVNSRHVEEERSWPAEWAAPYRLVGALFFPLDEKAFAPRRNERLRQAVSEMRRDYGDEGVKVFESLLAKELEDRGMSIEAGSVRINHPNLRWGEWPGSREIKVPPDLQNRFLFWNRRARDVLAADGTEGLIDDPAVMLLTLGMGYWGDFGNLMGEFGRVGDRLDYGGKVDGGSLRRQLGVAENDFVIFTHIKHSTGAANGLYNEAFKHLLDNPGHLTLMAYLSAYKRAADLMDLNPGLDKIVSPGSWFYDPELGKVEPRLAWVKEVAGGIVPVGLAREIAPAQLDFALSNSETRRAAYSDGKYSPVVTARVISRGEIGDILSREGELLSRFPET